MEKKVLVIGAGIAGLSAGIYAARSGFDVTILEQHIIPGGLSTGWSRKGYFFEGGMHWLTGSSDKLPLNRVWRETGALQENNPIDNRDPVYTLMDGDKKLCFYRDSKKFRDELLAYAPEDAAAIKRLFKHINAYKNVHLIVNDLPGVKVKTPAKQKLSELLKMTRALPYLKKLTKQSYMDYVDQFKNKNVRHLLRSVIGYRYNALSFIYTLGSFASGDSGYPLGGSVRMAKNMADTFEGLGGKIMYRTRVENIKMENGKAKGVATNSGFIECDHVIVCSDTRVAIDSFFDPPIDALWPNRMRRTCQGEQDMFICLGIKANLSKYPQCMIFPLDTPFEYAGRSFKELRINNYSKYSDHAPENCTSVTCLLLGDSYAYWKQAKEDGTYKEKKKELVDKFIQELQKFIPEIKDNIEVIDVATPCTYERYCSCYQGSWMDVMKPGDYLINHSQRILGYGGVYFAGQRMMSPGGLPLAVYSGRQAVQLLCKDTDTLFV